MELIEYITIIKKEKRIILIGTLLCTLAGAIYSLVMKPVFEAKAVLISIPPKAQKIGTEATSWSLTMLSLKDLLESKDLLDVVRHKLGWQKQIKLHELAKMVEAELSIEEDTNIRKTYSPHIILHAKANTPQDAAKLANTWAEEFIKRYNQLTLGVSSSTHRLIAEQYMFVKNELEQAEKKLTRLKNELPYLRMSLERKICDLIGYFPKKTESGPYLTSEELIKWLRAPEIRRDQSVSVGGTVSPVSAPEAKVVIESMPSSVGVLESDKLIGYEGQLSDIEMQIAFLEKQAEQKNDETIVSKLTELRIKKAQLQNKINQLKKEILQLQQIIANREEELAAVEREVAVLSSKFITLGKRKEEVDLEQATIAQALKSEKPESEDIKIAAYAVPPDKKISPKRTLITLSSAGIGLVFFTFIAFLREYLASVKLPQST